MSQNIGRLPIIGDTTRSWSVVKNPYGDDPQVAGYAISCYDPVTGEHTIESDLFETSREAKNALDRIFSGVV